jgi:hypothetical protein
MGSSMNIQTLFYTIRHHNLMQFIEWYDTHGMPMVIYRQNLQQIIAYRRKEHIIEVYDLQWINPPIWQYDWIPPQRSSLYLTN